MIFDSKEVWLTGGIASLPNFPYGLVPAQEADIKERIFSTGSSTTAIQGGGQVDDPQN